MPAIETRSLTKTFQTGSRRKRRVIEAVSGIDLRVERGERIAYIGPNGAGKSTSIKIFTGILHPTSGEASVLGFVPWQQRRRLTRHIGVLFGQRSQLWSELTARQGLRLLGAIYGMGSKPAALRIDEVAELLDARDLLDQAVRSFSLGQRMRCELAAAMLHSPDILFLDEPTIGLDLVAKQIFRELVARLNEEHNTTIFLTSHDVADIEAVAKRVVIINHGTVIYDDTVPALRQTLLSTKLIEVHFESPGTPVDLAGVEVVSSSPMRCELRLDTKRRPVKDVLDAILGHNAVADISVTDPPLEDVIGQIYSGQLS